MADTGRDDRVSSGLMRFLDSLTPDERAQFAEVMRQPNTFLAEDITDLLVILDGLNRN
jgi:hypothetical protein